MDHALSSALGIPEVYAVPLTNLASESDLVIVLAPGGNETFHIVDEAFLRRMKKTAVLINVARGSLVDTDALVRVLKEGLIHGAGLDVIEGEPNVDLDHPLLHEPRYATQNRGCFMAFADEARLAAYFFHISVLQLWIHEPRWRLWQCGISSMGWLACRLKVK